MSSPARVAHVVHDLRIGGTERRMVSVLAALDRSRFEPVVYCLDGLGPLESELHALGIEPVVLGRASRRDPRGILRLARLVRREGIDLVHGWLFLPNVYARLGGRLGGARAVVVAEGGAVIAFDHRRARAVATVDRLLAPLAAVAVANSEAVAANLRSTAVPARELVVIHNGVEPPVPLSDEERRRLRSALGVREDERAVAMVARLDPTFKDHESLLAAAARLQTPRVRILVVGDGPPRDLLERRAAELGVADRVTFTGFRADVGAVLGSVDASILLSYSEGFSNVVLESLARGLPTVLTDIPPNREAAGDAALFVPVGDVTATAAAIDRALTPSSELDELRARGRARVARFTPEEQGRLTMALYDRLLARR